MRPLCTFPRRDGEWIFAVGVQSSPAMMSGSVARCGAARIGCAAAGALVEAMPAVGPGMHRVHERHQQRGGTAGGAGTTGAPPSAGAAVGGAVNQAW